MEYSKFISHTVSSIPPSGIRKYFDLLGEDSISFGVGEPDFPTPDDIRYPTLEQLKKGRIAYTSNAGDPKLRHAILRFLNERYGFTVEDIEQVLITVGASQAIDLAFRAILDPGDEVIVHEPSYVAYAPSIRLAGGVPVSVYADPEQGYIVHAADIAAAITKRTKALLLAFPNNPTGAVMRREQLEEIAKVLRGTNVLVVSDEIYSELTYDGIKHVSIATLPDMAERTIVLNGFSKAFSMTGWRLGYAVGPKPLIEAMRKVHQLTMLSAPTPAQIAGTIALESGFQNDWKDTQYMVGEYAKRRKVMLSAFEALGLPCGDPKGAFYVFPDIRSTGLQSEAFCDALLSEKKVACIPGMAFGPYGEGHIRCCYAASLEQVTEGMARITDFVHKLRGY